MRMGLAGTVYTHPVKILNANFYGLVKKITVANSIFHCWTKRPLLLFFVKQSLRECRFKFALTVMAVSQRNTMHIDVRPANFTIKPRFEI